MDKILWEDFAKIDMRVGTVLTAEVFKQARNPSYKITIDFGSLGIKKSSAQLTKLYEVDDLIGKQLIAVVNFPEKQIANMMSECLVLGILGADDVKEVTLISPDKLVANGTKIA